MDNKNVSRWKDVLFTFTAMIKHHDQGNQYNTLGRTAPWCWEWQSNASVLSEQQHRACKLITKRKKERRDTVNGMKSSSESTVKPPPIRPQLFFLFKQFYHLVTKHSNMWAYECHSHPNNYWGFDKSFSNISIFKLELYFLLSLPKYLMKIIFS